MELIRGNKYRFNHTGVDPDLMYVGRDKNCGFWHQFTKFEDGRWGKIYSQISDEDLGFIEEVKE